MFTHRLIRPEMLDHVSPEEARPNLQDLVRINRYFGGHSVILKTLNQAARPSDAFSLLDIGAASGDTARTIQAAFPSASVVSLDYHETNLSAAPYPKVLGDAFRLPFPPNSFDYVLCSLFLHHFQDEQVVDLLRSFHAIARKALVVCDLERHIVPYLFLPATRLLFGWHKITVHDGIISVRAAFKREELDQLARKAGIKNLQIQGYRPAFRIALLATK